MGNKEGFLMQYGCSQTWSETQRQALALLKFIRECLSYDVSNVIDLAGDFIATVICFSEQLIFLSNMHK
jgi:hypothetical protein